ncbi:DUF4124 domain-containing protein [Candidatus Igneacidithiobacillus taiwanensis]|uniref:DUF4124 domain-containing protein n=1 Tax=Candidatus Igneacidithiobacillus taiwanensis TaxID=1945924 RepID=UPI0028976820|nr:DUF4124 domain-containing protein [Candidatus Igneacidithiobacillus taiwanensis]
MPVQPIRSLSSLLFAAVLTMSLLPTANAAIYRWVSPDGVVTYGGNPPANAIGVQTIDGMPAAAPPSTPSPSVKAPLAHTEPAPVAPAVSEKSPAQPALQAELAAARLQLLQATRAYNEGKSVRYGNERNYARYQERIDRLKEAVHVAQLRVLLLEHQLNGGAAETDTP